MIATETVSNYRHCLSFLLLLLFLLLLVLVTVVGWIRRRVRCLWLWWRSCRRLTGWVQVSTWCVCRSTCIIIIIIIIWWWWRILRTVKPWAQKTLRMQSKIRRLYISIKSTGQYMSNITEVHQGITSPACHGADQHHKRCKTLLQIRKLLHAYDHHTTFIFTPFTRRVSEWVGFNVPLNTL